MRKLKLYGAPPGNPVRFSPKDLQDHSSKIGMDTSNLSEEMLANVAQIMDINDALDAVPEWPEIFSHLGKTKESSRSDF